MVFRRFVVCVIVDRLVSFDALLVVSVYILKDWDNCSDSTVAAAPTPNLVLERWRHLRWWSPWAWPWQRICRFFCIFMCIVWSTVVVRLKSPIANSVTLFLSIGLYVFFCVLASSTATRRGFGYYVVYTLLLISTMSLSIYDIFAWAISKRSDQCLSQYALMVGGISPCPHLV
jgi:hypothetical protein